MLKTTMLPHSRVATLKPIIVILGPTAIGKTRVSIDVAKALDTDILTADSRQVYRGMDIGTDKPTLPERQGVSHQLIDLADPDQHFTTGDYRRHAITAIEKIHNNGQIPLIAGGTGLYIQALLHGLWPGPPANWDLRKALDTQAQEKGSAYVHQQLSRVDPVLAKRVHPNDYVKIQRGLEVYQALGMPLSQVHQRHNFQETPYHALVIGLNMKRELLYQRIESRVELEIEKGLIQETQQLLDRGYHRTLSSMTSLGYRQMAGFLAGDYSYEEAVRLLKRDTRHFAKRQITWFRRETSTQWLHVEEQESKEHIAKRILHCVDPFLSELMKKSTQSSEPMVSFVNS
ncbi:MAG: tRNA (adenosine(37)-N6)-dimethylallyltransferase MiaA [Nitrospirales bacterium]